MSDGASGAPATAAPAAAPTKAAPPAQTKQAEAPAWSDKDDADTFERLKRAPWAKVKANGEEKHISSKDDFLALVADASRGRGANKLVEETKKERAAVEAVKREAEGIKQTLERARRGDEKALRELGLIRDQADELTQEQFDALPEAVKRQLVQARELEQKQRAYETQQQQAEREATEAKKREATEKVKAQAREYAKQVLADVKEELHDVELPEIISAMYALRETGARLGRDYSPEHLAAFVKERRGAAINDRVSTLKPDAALKLVVPHLKALMQSPEGLKTLEAVLGEDFELVAGKLSGYRLEKWRAGKQKAATQPPAPTQRAEEPPKRQPLDPFRRW